MKCINCANLIPDASVVCPYCNAKVEPVVQATPVYNVDAGNNGVPITPVQPVLPQDQNMTVPPVLEPAPVIEPVSPVAPSQTTPVSPVVEPVVASPNVENNVVEPMNNVNNVETNGGMPQVPTAPMETLDIPSVAPVESVAVLGGSEVPPAEPITLSTEVAGGEKLGSTAPVKERKKKKLLLIIIIALIALLLIGGGVFAYMYEFKSGDKRIDIIVDALFADFNRMSNENFEVSSGTYNMKFDVSTSSEKMGAKISGKYATDLSKKLIDYTINVDSLNIGEELLDESLNVELYMNENKIYVLLQNFYDKYIYTDLDTDFLLGIEQNDINYKLMINNFKAALKAALKGSNYKQTVGDANIAGKKEKANVITMSINTTTTKRMMSIFYNNLMRNNLFLEECAKLANSDAQAVKKSLQEALDSLETLEIEGVTNINIYTKLIGNGFVGMTATSINGEEKTNIVIAPVNSGYNMTISENGTKLADFTINRVKKTTSTTREETMTVKLILNVEEEVYTVDAEIGVIDDINPKVEKVNVKNSVDVKYLPEADMYGILTKITQFGKLGILVSDFIGVMSPAATGTPEECALPINCQDGSNGFKTCTVYADSTKSTTKEVMCPTNPTT